MWFRKRVETLGGKVAEIVSDERKPPRHVAIIMDGNGRWAKAKGLPRELGHKAGVDSMREIIRESGRLGIEALTLYAFSTENWNRSPDEVNALMSLMLDCFRRETDELIKQNVRVRVIGDTSRLPAAQQVEIESTTSRTADRTGLQLNLAINYGGRDELLRAMKRIAERVKVGAIEPNAITLGTIEEDLDTCGLPDVDLVIRTSGENRLSNFLPYQTAYAEFVITDTLWPDFNVEKYHAALEAYYNRSRRFGGR